MKKINPSRGKKRVSTCGRRPRRFNRKQSKNSDKLALNQYLSVAPFSFRFHTSSLKRERPKLYLKIFENNGWWTDYYKKYPGSQGYLVLSKIGFSADGNQALFYATNSCGGKCGTETYVVMQRSDTGWKLVKEILIGVS
jgi:hypothetical protein